MRIGLKYLRLGLLVGDPVLAPVERLRERQRQRIGIEVGCRRRCARGAEADFAIAVLGERREVRSQQDACAALRDLFLSRRPGRTRGRRGARGRACVCDGARTVPWHRDGPLRRSGCVRGAGRAARDRAGCEPAARVRERRARLSA